MANFLTSMVLGPMKQDLTSDLGGSGFNPMQSDPIGSMLGMSKQPQSQKLFSKSAPNPADYQNYADMAKQFQLTPVAPPSDFSYSSFLGGKK